MFEKYSHREVTDDDLVLICSFPKSAEELFLLFPSAAYPLTVPQLKASVMSRYDSTVIMSEGAVVGFANFYEVIKYDHCSIGNVIVDPQHRGQGLGEYLIGVMEEIAITKYHVKEIHISCFNSNVVGLLLYTKLGYKPYKIDKRLDKYLKPLALINTKKVV